MSGEQRSACQEGGRQKRNGISIRTAPGTRFFRTWPSTHRRPTRRGGKHRNRGRKNKVTEEQCEQVHLQENSETEIARQNVISGKVSKGSSIIYIFIIFRLGVGRNLWKEHQSQSGTAMSCTTSVLLLEQGYSGPDRMSYSAASRRNFSLYQDVPTRPQTGSAHARMTTTGHNLSEHSGSYTPLAQAL